MLTIKHTKLQTHMNIFIEGKLYSIFAVGFYILKTIYSLCIYVMDMVEDDTLCTMYNSIVKFNRRKKYIQHNINEYKTD